MPSPIKMRTDYSAPQLRVLAKSAKTNSQNLLLLAVVPDAMHPTDAARVGGKDRSPAAARLPTDIRDRHPPCSA